MIDSISTPEWQAYQETANRFSLTHESLYGEIFIADEDALETGATEHGFQISARYEADDLPESFWARADTPKERRILGTLTHQRAKAWGVAL